jgi:cytoskeletal protein RodZ
MKVSSIFTSARPLLAALFFAPFFALPATAQSPTTPAPTQAAPPVAATRAPAPPSTKQTQPSTQDDSGTVSDSAASPSPIDRRHHPVSQNVEEAWSILKTAATDQKKAESRAQAIAAIGTIQGSPLAHKLVSDALNDTSIDVRASAIVAVGTLHDKGLQGKLREMLADTDPQIVFTAATTLWKMGDKSAEDILIDVTEGDRKASVSLLKSTGRTANKDLHSPAKLAELGARQGAGYLLGPFGIGITAWDYTHQHPGENPRVTALTLLAEDKTANIHATLLDALDDKDSQVRAAAARALGDYRIPAASLSLLHAFDDDKLSVRLLSAASYIRVNSAAAHQRPVAKK